MPFQGKEKMECVERGGEKAAGSWYPSDSVETGRRGVDAGVRGASFRGTKLERDKLRGRVPSVGNIIIPEPNTVRGRDVRN